jgi:hypothetical protein
MLSILLLLITFVGVIRLFWHLKLRISLAGSLRMVFAAATILFLNLTEFTRPIGVDAGVPYHLLESGRGFPIVAAVKLRKEIDIQDPENARYLKYWTQYEEVWLYSRTNALGNLFFALAMLLSLLLFEIMLANRKLHGKSMQVTKKLFPSHKRE